MDFLMDFELPSDDDEEIIEFIATGYFNRTVSERTNHFDTMQDKEFFRIFRLTKYTVLNLLKKIEHKLEFSSGRNQSVSPMNQILCSLRFYATGRLKTSANVISIHQSTACRIIPRVTDAIARLYPEYVKFPISAQEQNEIATEFYNIARFPRVIGALDCTHVRMHSPGGKNAEIYRCRKGFFSLNVQAICNYNLEFLDVVARWHGSAHDSHIWDKSFQKRTFLQGIYGDKILLGDSDYAQTPHMMVPFAAVTSRQESLYNESHIRTRNVVERAFELWKGRFPILSRGVQLKLKRIPGIIVATAVLHNIALRHGEEEPPEDPEFPLLPEVADPSLTSAQIQARQTRLQNTGLGERQVMVEKHFATLDEI